MNKVKITWKAFGDKAEQGRFITSVEFEHNIYDLTHFTTDSLNIGFCERIYKATNIYSGQLWDIIEPKLSQFRTHTAISVGDEIEIDGQVYICADFGFEKIEDVEIKYFGESVFSVSKKQEVSQ